MSLKYFFKVGDNNYLVEVLRRFLYSRWYVTTPPVQMCSTHFDRSMQTMLAEFRKHHGLDRQLNVFPMGSLLDAATYQKIGDEMSDAEIAIAAVHDVEIKKLLYGDPCADWETVGKVITKDQFVGWGHKAIKENCFDYCKEQLRVVGRAMKSPYWGDKTMKANIYQLYLTEDVAGMKKGIQPRQFINAVKYLKQAVKGKVPVVTGVDDEEGSPNKDKVTDHFVTIVGMGTDSHGKYFHFFDNAVGDKNAGTSDNNKLYPDCDVFMITGTGDNEYARARRHYIVTQVRVSE